MMKHLSLIILFLLTVLHSSGKGIEAYISGFSFQNDAEEWCWSISQDVNNYMLFGVAEGVIVYDGVSENLIHTTFTPEVMLYDTLTKCLWISGGERVGALKPNGVQDYVFEELPGVQAPFTHIVESEEYVYFCSTHLILEVEKETFAIKSEIKLNSFFDFAFSVQGTPYFIVDYFLYTLKDGQLIEDKRAELPVDAFSFYVPLEDQILLGTASNSYYLFNGVSFRTVEIEENDFFNHNYIITASYLGNNKLALASIAGGLAFLDLKTAVIDFTMDYFNGLPDDEVRTTFVDAAGGLWVSHAEGISRVDLNLGIENFGYFIGLKGKPLSLQLFQEELYIGTTEGLYKLSDVKTFEETTSYISVPYNVQVRVPVQQQNAQENAEEFEANSGEKGSQGWFKKRRAKKEADSLADQAEQTVSTQETEVTTKTIRKYRRKSVTKRKLTAIKQQFMPIEGVYDKCEHMEVFQNCLLIGGASGLYVLRKGEVQQLLKDTYINAIYFDKEKVVAYFATDNGLYYFYYNGSDYELDHYAQTTDVSYKSMIQEDNKTWVLANSTELIRCNFHGKHMKVLHRAMLPEAPGKHLYLIHDKQKTLLFAGNNRYVFQTDGSLHLLEKNSEQEALVSSQPNVLWEKVAGGWSLIAREELLNKTEQSQLNLFDDIQYIKIDADKHIWVITTEHQILKLDTEKFIKPSRLQLRLLSTKGVNGVIRDKKNLIFKSNEAHISCQLSAPYFLKAQEVQYTYKLEGFDSDWSAWSTNSEIEIKYLPPGSYELQFKARNNLGQVSNVVSLPVLVKKQFTSTFVFYLLIVLVSVLLAFLLFRLRMLKLERNNKILEERVQERTETIVAQKSRIEKQHDEIRQSINYAQKIQNAMLPNAEIIEAVLPKHFVFYRPRDVVSGDFYFFKHVGKRFVFIAADSTGHGVPGGFMSMLGISYLSEITSQLKLPTTASEVLDHLRDKIKLTLQQNDIDNAQRDGMDMSVCLIEPYLKEIHFSGAYNSLIMIRDKELHIIDADRQPVAIYYRETEFTNHVIQAQEGDVFYMFSDGFPDQIGGPRDRKYMIKNFKKLLLEIHDKPFAEQKELLEDELEMWQGDQSQIDDILVVGFQL